MTLRFSAIRFYFRLCIYLLPLAAFALTLYLRFFAASIDLQSVDYNPHFYLVVLLIITFCWAIVTERNKLTQIEELFRENTGIRKASAAVGSTYLVIVLLQFFYRDESLSRLFFVISALALFLLTLLTRAGLKAILKRRFSSSRHLNILIIGADGYAHKVACALANIPFAHSHVVGYATLNGDAESDAVQPVFPLEDILNGAVRVDFDEVVVALPAGRLPQVTGLVQRFSRFQAPIRIVLDLGGFPVVRERFFTVGDLQLLDLTATPLESPKYFMLKRAFDLTFSVFAITLLAPLMLAIALAIKLTSRGPIFFRQQRVGLNGRVFTMYKFRTMRVAPLEESDRIFTSKDDPRRTRIGILLRKTSLDELPQFLNVIKGDMSVVGPRPERPFFVKKFGDEMLNYDGRHRLKVGITGWAQVNGWRGDTSIQKRVEADLYYLQNWSFILDLQIILLTVLRGFAGEHAY
jgi:Undecaprenyl-phosphate glucose phosphotransferase